MLRDYLTTNLYGGADPFPATTDRPVDIQGWEGSSHFWLKEVVQAQRPRLVIEVGVWKGASVLHIADWMREFGVDGLIVAVDTWLGSAEHYGERDDWRRDIATIYPTFLNNVVAAGLQQYIVPLRLDSVNAAAVLSRLCVQADVIHLDAAHDAMSVSMDLQAWWPLLRSGGVLIGDDYDPAFPGVVMAFDAFAERHSLVLEVSAPKVRVRKL